MRQNQQLNLQHVIALNVIYIIGSTPFITIPMIDSCTPGWNSLLPWVIGGFLALLDSFTWSEYGAYSVKSGGSYEYLKLGFPGKFGELLAFLYSWQIGFIAPLVISSIALGFSDYFSYLFPLKSVLVRELVAPSSILIVFFLANNVTSAIGKISKVLFYGLIFTLGLVIILGIKNFNLSLSDTSMPIKIDYKNWSWYLLLGQATVKSIYCYLGYYNSCHISDEIERPVDVIPRSMIWSVGIVCIIYLSLQIITIGNLPQSKIQSSTFLFSTLFETWFDKNIADYFTVVVLWLSIGCMFSIMIGYSRVLNASSQSGDFLPIGKRINRKFVPVGSLIWLSSIAIVACYFFSLDQLITSIVVLRIFIQFIAQGIGLLVMNMRGQRNSFPYRMPIFPLPVLLSIGIWLFAFISAKVIDILWALCLLTVGVFAFFLKKKIRRRAEA